MLTHVQDTSFIKATCSLVPAVPISGHDLLVTCSGGLYNLFIRNQFYKLHVTCLIFQLHTLFCLNGAKLVF